MAIEFSCPQCGETLRLKEKFAGQRGSCKHCGGEITVPAVASQGDLELCLLDDAPRPTAADRPTVRVGATKHSPSPRTPAANGATSNGASTKERSKGQSRSPAPADLSPASDDLIRFQCDQCGKNVKILSNAAGRSVACPRCANRLQVPGALIARPAARPTARPLTAAAAAIPEMDGLELLPESEDLELMPESDSLLDALDDRVLSASAASPLQPLPVSRPLTVSKKKRTNQQPFWQSPTMQALGGTLMSLLILAGIGAKLYRRVLAPMIQHAQSSPAFAQTNTTQNPPFPGASTPSTHVNASAPTNSDFPGSQPATTPVFQNAQSPIIAETQQALDLLDQNLRLAKQIVDASTAQSTAPGWASNFVDMFEALVQLDRHNGTRVSMTDKMKYDELTVFGETKANQVVEQLNRMTSNPSIQPIISNALANAVAARPTSQFAKFLRENGATGSPMQGLAGSMRRRSGQVMQEHRAQAEQRLEEMKIQSERMREEMKIQSEQMQEEMRARSEAMRNRHRLPGWRP